MPVNELVLWSLGGGAAVFLSVYFLSQKNKGFAWIATLIVASVVVFLVFPSPDAVKTVGDAANRLSAFIQMAIYLVAWLVGPVLLSIFLP